MKTEYLAVYKGSQGKVIKQVCEIFPHICIPVFTKAFVIKPVNLSNLSGFVVASENSYSFTESNLENKKIIMAAEL